jgi:hypothetical protein
MAKHMQLNVPKPCPENWNNMNETQRGRFCLSCQKEVIDFTLMTDQQILNHISKANSGVCGRFTDNQLNRDIVMKNERKLTWFKYFMHVIIPAILLTSKSSAQQVKINGDTIVCKAPDLIRNNSTMLTGTVGGLVVGKQIKNKSVIITGNVTDEKNEPVPFASIRIKGSNTGISADVDGAFKLTTPKNSDHITLIASGVGYEPNELPLNLNNANGNSLKVSLSLKVHTTTGLGEVVVVAGYTVAKKTEKKPILQPVIDTIANVFIKDTVKIYPNPVHAGGMMNIDFDVKNAGEYNLTILNISGQIVMNKKIELNSKQQIEQIACDNRITPGIYVVQITGALGKKYYSNKIMVL